MHISCLNIYRLARDSAGITREQASEKINSSVRSLADYETGKTVPGDDIVCLMIEVYNTQWLSYKHLQQSSKVGQRYLPDIELTDLPKSVLRFQKEVNDLSRVKDDMVEVACDGRIEEDEMHRWSKAKKEVKEVIKAGFELLFARQEVQG